MRELAVQLNGKSGALRSLVRSHRRQRRHSGNNRKAVGQGCDLYPSCHGHVIKSWCGRGGHSKVDRSVCGIRNGDRIHRNTGTDSRSGCSLDKSGEVPDDAHVECRIALVRIRRTNAADDRRTRRYGEGVSQRCRFPGGGQSYRDRPCGCARRNVDEGGRVRGVCDRKIGDNDASAKACRGGSLGKIGEGTHDCDAETGDAQLPAVGSDAADGRVTRLHQERTVQRSCLSARVGDDVVVAERSYPTDGDVRSGMRGVGHGDRVRGHAIAEIECRRRLREVRELTYHVDRGKGFALPAVVGIHRKQHRRGGVYREPVAEGSALTLGGQRHITRVDCRSGGDINHRGRVRRVGERQSLNSDSGTETRCGLSIGEMSSGADNGYRDPSLPLATRVRSDAADRSRTRGHLEQVNSCGSLRAGADRNVSESLESRRIDGDVGGGVGEIDNGGGIHGDARAEIRRTGPLHEMREQSRDGNRGDGGALRARRRSHLTDDRSCRVHCEAVDDYCRFPACGGRDAPLACGGCRVNRDVRRQMCYIGHGDRVHGNQAAETHGRSAVREVCVRPNYGDADVTGALTGVIRREAADDRRTCRYIEAVAERDYFSAGSHGHIAGPQRRRRRDGDGNRGAGGVVHGGGIHSDARAEIGRGCALREMREVAQHRYAGDGLLLRARVGSYRGDHRCRRIDRESVGQLGVLTGGGHDGRARSDGGPGGNRNVGGGMGGVGNSQTVYRDSRAEADDGVDLREVGALSHNRDADAACALSGIIRRDGKQHCGAGGDLEAIGGNHNLSTRGYHYVIEAGVGGRTHGYVCGQRGGCIECDRVHRDAGSEVGGAGGAEMRELAGEGDVAAGALGQRIRTDQADDRGSRIHRERVVQ